MHRLAFQIIHPERRTTSVVFASPHSGRDYPRSFLRQSALNEHAIRSSEDAFVDELFETAPVHGAPLLCASVPRAMPFSALMIILLLSRCCWANAWRWRCCWSARSRIRGF